MTSRSLVLALDVGTSSVRASLFDAMGRRVRCRPAQRAYTVRTTADGGAELDAEELLAITCQAVDVAVGLTRIRKLGTVVAVAPATFWHGLLGIDDAGKPTTPVYLWMDARSRVEADELRRELSERAVHARTGCMLHWSYWPAKLRWVQRHRPALAARTRRWVSFSEYLQRAFTGRWGPSVSIASGTGLLDHATSDWDPSLLQAVGVPRDQLSEVNGTAVRGDELGTEARARWPSLEEARFFAPVGDGAASNVGAGCVTRDHLAVMIGTSVAVRVLDRSLGSPPFRLWRYRLDRNRPLVGGAMNDGGSLLDWLRGTLRLPASESLDSEIGRMEPLAHGLTVLPFWGGERSPGWAPDARGAILGLRLHSRPTEIVRAAMEGVAVRVAAIVDSLDKVVGGSPAVVATGAALLHSPAWMQIMADALGRPVLASGEPQGSSRGAAVVALEALGLLPHSLEAERPLGPVLYEPDLSRHERFLEAIADQATRAHAVAGTGPVTRNHS